MSACNYMAKAPELLLHAQKLEKNIYILNLKTTLIHFVSFFLLLMFVEKNISGFSFDH